jgi:hypothetical protein
MLFLLLSSSAAGLDQTAEWSVHSMTGYDSEVLVDPERDGVTESAERTYTGLGGRLRVRLSGLGTRSGRLVLITALDVTGYRGEGPGEDHHLRAMGGYHCGISNRTFLSATGSLVRFRRRTPKLFDVDRSGLGLRITRQIGRPWLVGVGVENAWISLPGRLVSNDSTRTASDQRLDLLVSVRREFPGAGYVRLEFGQRRVTSNDDPVASEGPLVTLQWGSGRRGRSELTAFAKYGQRFYRNYPVLTPSEGAQETTGDRRNDATWRIGAELEHAVSPGLEFFVRGSVTNQISNASGLDFDRTRVAAGFRFTIRDHTRHPGAGTSPRGGVFLRKS